MPALQHKPDPNHIIARQPVPRRPGRDIVLRCLGGFEPYVTHCYEAADDAYYWGHYCMTYEEALEDYEERCKRGY